MAISKKSCKSESLQIFVFDEETLGLEPIGVAVKRSSPVDW
ncbi:hypothetical protein CE91St49_26660 [Emergencia timonensis]|nr:hypothetical protein CE91St48_26730 [Emergencia timonensis]BDF13319.1 hypothetical protein CE91St49_26660 [Emergencia timonensis]